MEELEDQYGENTDDLCNDHEQLIEQILEEEEQLIHAHRAHIDEVVSVVKDEMHLLNEVDKPGSDVEQYAKNLDKVLLKKINIISEIREKLCKFYSHLKTEEHMSKLYERNQDIAIRNMGIDTNQTTDIDSSQATQPTYNQSNHPQFQDIPQNMVQASGNLVDDILNGVHDSNMPMNRNDLLGDLNEDDLLT